MNNYQNFNVRLLYCQSDGHNKFFTSSQIESMINKCGTPNYDDGTNYKESFVAGPFSKYYQFKTFIFMPFVFL